VVLIGEPTRSARTAIPADWHDRVVDLGGHRPARDLVRDLLSEKDGPELSLVAIGNIHGQGELLIAELDKLPTIVAEAHG
jgi:hypothetical protein